LVIGDFGTYLSEGMTRPTFCPTVAYTKRLTK